MPPQQKYDRGDLRRLNAVNVLGQLTRHGLMSRANIAGSLGLTRATVSKIVADLIEASLVRETDHHVNASGRPGMLLDLNPEFGCMIGVEIDLDRISILAANLGRKTIWRAEESFALNAPSAEVLRKAAALVDEAIQRGRRRGLNCLGICVAWAGLVSREKGELVYGPTSGWQQVPLKRKWEEKFGVPVFVENEAHVGAIGAYHYGPNRGKKNLIYLSLGVGMGAGVFVDGILLRGKQGFAGQIGHTTFGDNGILCGCGKRSCWVTEVGASAVLRKLKEAKVEVPVSLDTGVEWLDSIQEKALHGDQAVTDVIQAVGRQLGTGLAHLVQTFNPSLVLVGGRMRKLMKEAEPAIRQALFKATLPYMAEPLQLVISDSEDDQLNGCLATVFDSIVTNPGIGSLRLKDGAT